MSLESATANFLKAASYLRNWSAHSSETYRRGFFSLTPFVSGDVPTKSELEA